MAELKNEQYAAAVAQAAAEAADASGDEDERGRSRSPPGESPFFTMQPL